MKGLKNFLIQDDKNMITKILFGIEKFKQGDSKLPVVETKFSRTEYEKIAKRELGNLSATARNLFHFVNKFGKLYNVRDETNIYFIDD